METVNATSVPPQTQWEQQLDALDPKTSPAARVGLQALKRSMTQLGKTLDVTRAATQNAFERSAKGQPLDLELLNQSVAQLQASLDQNSLALMTLTSLRLRDNVTYEHCCNSAAYLIAFAKTLGLPNQEIKAMGLAGLVHDLGKARIPTDILNKQGHLNDNDKRFIYMHVPLTLRLLKDISDTNQTVMQAVEQHHERLDGSGYPQGIKGGQIGRPGRMIAIVDSFEAATSKRPYRDANRGYAILQEMLADAGEKYDKTLFQAFVKLVGVYPSGSIVELKNGMIASVVQNSAEHLLHPLVIVFAQSSAHTVFSIQLVDLHEHAADPDYNIIKVRSDLAPPQNVLQLVGLNE
ncbi:metal dependent phosphohydrolase [Magnetococcus marinus MC-1]|uniref:Metal dependent phosphohydrolase n=1 Tax=Magnetococcus marinus (strain ATCC BAA-1437 / JCM 17883 / MC-1) TaxID=156889 RepID=A0LBU2_MAGMM|nr:HD-GYP domain-containing protein [Magnetococcus marinus]ABK45435.1 metal dependent phosphohydrolase [Magnetococcus marinus MC-1]